MFCTKCGANIADDAVFCLNCGSKVESVAEEKVEEVIEKPVQQTYQPAFSQPTFATQQSAQSVQPVFQQSVQQMPVKKGSKAAVPAAIFLILSVITSIMISLSSFLDGKIGIGVENIGFVVSAILITVFAFSTSGITSILKGVGLSIATVLHVIFFGVSAFMAVFDIFGNAEAGIDYYNATILLLELVCFYVYMLMNIIRSFMNSKKASSVMLLLGYIAALLIVVAFVIDWVSDINGLFAFKFIPIDLGLVFMVLGDIFAVISRAKKQA